MIPEETYPPRYRRNPPRSDGTGCRHVWIRDGEKNGLLEGPHHCMLCSDVAVFEGGMLTDYTRDMRYQIAEIEKETANATRKTARARKAPRE